MGVAYLAPVLAAIAGAVVAAVVARYRHPIERDNTLANTAHALGQTLDVVAADLRRTQQQLQDALTRIDHLTQVVESYREKLANYETRWGDLLDD